ncbi:hypothetical protein [Microvirus mar60]|uniref:Uncharacterized protein n=1 Tax=Microvirus mar60 TaxID=2851197 RepID=A0A8F5MJ71_9VIRU|nr:hypothetical protein [Microvirus mar60]
MIIRKTKCKLPKRWNNETEFEEGERIETKISRVLENNEPIEDGAPEIYTPKNEGVIAAYNIRTDRWEIAQEAMSKIYAEQIAKAKNYGKKNESAAAEPAATESAATESAAS